MQGLFTIDKPKISWFVWVDGKTVPRSSKMAGTWGYDATCTCGWATKTGGATKSYITNEIWFHKFADH